MGHISPQEVRGVDCQFAVVNSILCRLKRLRSVGIPFFLPEHAHRPLPVIL